MSLSYLLLIIDKDISNKCSGSIIIAVSMFIHVFSCNAGITKCFITRTAIKYLLEVPLRF